MGPALGGSWSPAQRLLAACVEAVRVRRISAADRYPVHRAYPSPRGLFGADLFLLPASGAAWCLRVDPQSHALQPLGGPGAPADLDQALTEARLVVAADRHRYPPEYGRLRPSLARLEGGHLLASLGLTLTRAGLHPRTHPNPAHPACIEASPLLPEGTVPIAAITLDSSPDPGASGPNGATPLSTTAGSPETPGSHEAHGSSGSGETHRTRGAAEIPRTQGNSGTYGATVAVGASEAPEADGFPDSPWAQGNGGVHSATGDSGAHGVRAGVISPGAAAGVADSVAPSGRSLRRWLDERTSGVSTANLVTSAHVSPEQGSTVTSGLVWAFAAVREALPEPGALRLYRHVLAGDRVDDRVVCELFPDGSEGPARPVPRTGETNFSATLGYTLAVDFPAWARAHGAEHAETVLHTLLGWIAQWGCLGAAATGLCARPMRNYSEEDWASVLGLAAEQTPAYQLWVRAERGTYLDIPVDAAPETP